MLRPRPLARPAVRTAALTALVALGGAALAACGTDGTPPCDPTEPGCRPLRQSLSEGDFVTLNARTDSACATSTRGQRVGRVAAVSNRAIVVADTGNPRPTLSDADYRSIAAAFDTLVYPVDVRNFGTPTDLDGNGRVIIFYTRAVNDLTPRDAGFVIGGFFWNRDLFPRTGGQSACAGSNDAEMVYMLAPDPSGTINGNVRTRESVLTGTVGVIAHEFQHLINASRRLYVLRTSNYDEVTWLNEGMSHVAEELTFFQSAGLSPAGQAGQSPRSRLTIQALRDRPGATSALNTFNSQNLSRFSRYLRVVSDSSPYANNDGLATRGAAWSFLRYAADRLAQPDSVFLRRLINSTQLGYENLAAATGAGSTLPEWFRDWAVANYADGLATNTAPRFGYTSWNFRALLPSVASNNGLFPIATQPLANGQSASVSLGGGMAAYFPFTVPAGAAATLRTRTAGGGAPSANVRVTLVRVTEQTGTTIVPYAAGEGNDVTVDNGTAAVAQYALVVFNGSATPTAREALTVTGTGLGARPAANAAVFAAGAGAAQAGPTLARLDAGDAVPTTDAPVHQQLRAIGERELSWRVAGARAEYDARRAGAARQ